MKNSIKNNILMLILCLLIILADTGVCFAESFGTGSGVLPFKTVIFKFILTMGVALLSLVVVFFALIIYKKYSADVALEHKKKSLYGDSFSTPKTMDDAIVSFIQKNKL